MTDKRCDWCLGQPLYEAYHDEEWGVPLRDSGKLFELLMLEGMQAGLSWWTILQKRAAMRQLFFEFDPQRLANEGEAEIETWLQNPEIIRHRGKLQAMVGNARAYLQVDDFSDFIWSAVDHQPKVNRFETLSQVPAQTEASQALSKQLKKAGFKFVGPTIVYAFMQSAGLVNDHLVRCPRHKACAESGTR